MSAARGVGRGAAGGDGLAFSARRRLYQLSPLFDHLTITGSPVAVGADGCGGWGSLDAPDLLPVGGCCDVSGFWYWGDDLPQMIVRRGAE